MHVIVVGCGRVGSELAVRLTREGHTVSIIDKNPNSFRRIPEGWNGQKIRGFGFDRDSLIAAGIENAGAVAAVTSGDNSNILTARIARETFDVRHVVARIYDPRRAVIYQRLGIPTVATVSWTVDQVVRRMFPEEGSTTWTDPTGDVSLVEHLLPERYCGVSFAEFTESDRYRPVLVTRGGQARVVTPGMVGQEGDIVHFAVRGEALHELTHRLAPAQPAAAAAGAPGTGRGDPSTGDPA